MGSLLRIAVVAAVAGVALLAPTATADAASLQERIDTATADAATRGVTVGIAFRDRATGMYFANRHARAASPSASVAKVFIADNVLLRDSRGEIRLDNGDRGAIAAMLRSSDDGAAQRFWDKFGGRAIVADVLARYRLGDAKPTGAWYDTQVSPADMVHYYNQLVGGQGGLPPSARDFLVSQLRAWSPRAADGYNQNFGLPHALREPVQAVKQGWMQAGDGQWIHNSTDIVAPDARYVVAVFTRAPARVGDRTACDIINRVAGILFPHGHIDSSGFPSPSTLLPQVASMIENFFKTR